MGSLSQRRWHPYRLVNSDVWNSTYDFDIEIRLLQFQFQYNDIDEVLSTANTSKMKKNKFILYNVSCILNSKRHQFVSLLLHCYTATYRIFRTHVLYIRNFFPNSKPTNSTCYRLMQSNQSKSRTYALMYSDIFGKGEKKK